MGGTTFFIVQPGRDAKDAFRGAQERARWDHGNAGYTGTIAEKPNFVTIHCPSKSGSLPTVDEVAALFDQLVEKSDRRIDDKWGPAGCTEVTCEVRKDSEEEGLRWFAFYGWASC